MEYLKIGEKLIPIDRKENINGQEVPVIKATSEEKVYPDGRKDVIIHVPLLRLDAKQN